MSAAIYNQPMTPRKPFRILVRHFSQVTAKKQGAFLVTNHVEVAKPHSTNVGLPRCPVGLHVRRWAFKLEHVQGISPTTVEWLGQMQVGMQMNSLRWCPLHGGRDANHRQRCSQRSQKDFEPFKQSFKFYQVLGHKRSCWRIVRQLHGLKFVGCWDLPQAAEDPPGLALLLQKSLGTFACYCSLPPHRQEEGHGPGHLLQAIPLWLGQHCQRLVAGHTCVRHGSTLSHTAPSPGADLGSLLGYVLFGLRKMSQKPAAMRQCFARKTGKWVSLLSLSLLRCFFLSRFLSVSFLLVVAELRADEPDRWSPWTSVGQLSRWKNALTNLDLGNSKTKRCFKFSLCINSMTVMTMSHCTSCLLLAYRSFYQTCGKLMRSRPWQLAFLNHALALIKQPWNPCVFHRVSCAQVLVARPQV